MNMGEFMHKGIGLMGDCVSWVDDDEVPAALLKSDVMIDPLCPKKRARPSSKMRVAEAIRPNLIRGILVMELSHAKDNRPQ